ncbi:MAG: PSD1 domain-containing protein [Planctomycetes bacterium]|nr:PSD1 domain-containing protein [Planctomycetota bacterium]
MLLPVLAFCGALAAPAAGDTRTPLDFERDVRPILADACFRCHGPDAETRKANLRLDLREDLFGIPHQPTALEHIVEPEHPEASELFRRVSSTSDDDRMPPPTAQRQLSPEEIARLRQWIEEGASWSGHWAFQPLAAVEPPTPKNLAACRNPIDRFVQATLESRSMRPAPEADPRTLLRRLSLDLTGLPPTRAELDAFLADTAPDVYEKQVDRLLASPRYGEHMAWSWLDAARYADSNGFQLDPDRTAWPWRDWVVEAFNSNMGFDEFTLEQIAGDLLPNATQSQILASAFNRNHPINGEGGRDVEESRNDYVRDRVDATATTWLGLTLSCAQCHDHKYDPLPQRDYYRFSAYFDSIDETGGGEQGDMPPLLEYTDSAGRALKVMVMRDRPEPRVTHVHLRGAWDALGEVVEPGTPSALPVLGDAPQNRLGLAKWIVDPANPLSARVAANRLWQQIFGEGLVRTQDNFGAQGDRAEYPELLDWLAFTYRESGWDTKALVRSMVTSAAYRRSSACTPEQHAADPQDRWLARAPRFRLPATVLRDQALLTSGLLVEKLGGPPVKPYHPGGVWEDVSFGRLKYEQGHGEDLYRRTLYTFWRRTAAPANLFDVSLRQRCSVRVIRTDTPLQALTLMDDPTYAEAAAALAERVQKEGTGRIAWAFEELLSRPPSALEARTLESRLAALRTYYSAHPDEASVVACAGERADPPESERAEIAALAGVMTILFNLDEALSRE